MKRVWLLMICVAFAHLGVQQGSAQPVEFEIYTSQDVYHPGDTLEIYISLTNTGEGFDAELYVAIDFFGSRLFLPRLTPDVLPLAGGYLASGLSISDFLVFSCPLGEGIPETDYGLKGAILSAEDYSIMSNIADDEFAFESGGPSIEGRNEYLPLAEGYSWTYYAEGNDDSGEGTAIISEAEADGDIYIFHGIYAEDEEDTEVILVDNDGDIYIRDVIVEGDSMFDSDQLILPAEPEEGDNWTIWFSFEGLPVTATVRVEGKDSVSVPAGDFDDCWRLSVSAMFGLVDGNIWFAKDVGLVTGDLDAPFVGGGYIELLDYDLTGM